MTTSPCGKSEEKCPANQPPPPTKDNCDGGGTLPDKIPPTMGEPATYKPNADCHCPTVPTSTTNCFVELIGQQTDQIELGKSAGEAQKELTAFKTKAEAGSKAYTQEKYEEWLEQWKELDGLIAELIRKFVCSVPCWKCVLECYVCPLLYETYLSETRLYGMAKEPEPQQADSRRYSDSTPTNESGPANLYEQRDAQERYKKEIERQFAQIGAKLAAWDKPAETIPAVLKENWKLRDDIDKTAGADAPKVAYDLFLKLIPKHLAIAPPACTAVTKIEKKFTEFCIGGPDAGDGCKPSIDFTSVREQLIGPPLPYLIKPESYFDVVCCLAQHHYLPAKKAFGTAQGAWQKTVDEIKRREDQLKLDLDPKAFAEKVKGAIPSGTICNCEDPKSIKPTTTPTSR